MDTANKTDIRDKTEAECREVFELLCKTLNNIDESKEPNPGWGVIYAELIDASKIVVEGILFANAMSKFAEAANMSSSDLEEMLEKVIKKSPPNESVPKH